MFEYVCVMAELCFAETPLSLVLSLFYVLFALYFLLTFDKLLSQPRHWLLLQVYAFVVLALKVSARARQENTSETYCCRSFSFFLLTRAAAAVAGAVDSRRPRHSRQQGRRGHRIAKIHAQHRIHLIGCDF